MHPTEHNATPETPTSDQAASERTATRIRAIMAARRLKTRDLAAALDISPKVAARQIGGAHDFRLDELERIAVWLDVPVTELVGATAYDQPPRD